MDTNRKNPKNKYLFSFSDISYSEEMRQLIQRQEGYPDPTIDGLIAYSETIAAHHDRIDPEWAGNEIRNYLLSYVRVGLVADAVRRFKLYQKFDDASKNCKDFGEYCRKFVGKSEWYVNKIIDAAKVCLKLIKQGFSETQLPANEYQARPLVRLYQKAQQIYQAVIDKFCPGGTGENVPPEADLPPDPDMVLTEKWNTVISELPAYRITGERVAEIVEEKPEMDRPEKISLRASTSQRLKRAAIDAGMSLEEYLNKLQDMAEGINNEVIAEEEIAEEEIAEKEQIWNEDLNKLIEEHNESIKRRTASDAARRERQAAFSQRSRIGDSIRESRSPNEGFGRDSSDQCRNHSSNHDAIDATGARDD